jgi:hypothetical protein
MKIKLLAICFSAAILSSCGKYGTQYDKKYVKDSDGVVYQLEHRIGDCYFVNEVVLDTIMFTVK